MKKNQKKLRNELIRRSLYTATEIGRFDFGTRNPAKNFHVDQKKKILISSGIL